MNKTRRELILLTAEDLMADFLYYERKEDEDLPRGAIEAAIEAGEITIAEIVQVFHNQLVDACTDPS